MFPDGATEVLPTPVGIRRAKDMGLDLVVVSPTAIPPVAKIIDYGEFSYQEKKKKNEAKKKQHKIEVKEVKFRPNTDDHDYEFKKNHALRFLEEGNKVKGTVFFRGREITHPEVAEKLLLQLVQDLKELGEPEGRPRLEGRTMHLMFGPKKKPKKVEPKPKAAPSERPARPAPTAAAAEDEDYDGDAEDLDENTELGDEEREYDGDSDSEDGDYEDSDGEEYEDSDDSEDEES